MTTFVRPRMPSPVLFLGSGVAVTVDRPHMLNYSAFWQDEEVEVVSDLACDEVQLSNEDHEATQDSRKMCSS